MYAFSFSTKASSSVNSSSCDTMGRENPLAFVPGKFKSRPLGACPFLKIAMNESVFSGITPSKQLAAPTGLSMEIPFSPAVGHAL